MSDGRKPEAPPDSISSRLVEFALTCRLDDLAGEVLPRATYLLIDGFSQVGAASNCSEMAEVAALEGIKEQSLLPLPAKTSAETAAFLYGAMARFHDFGPVHPEALHTVEYTLPSMMGALHGVDAPIDGECCLKSFVLAEEIAVRLGRASCLMENDQHDQYDGGHGMVGAIIGAGLLLGLSRCQLEHAVGMGSVLLSRIPAAMFTPPVDMVFLHHGFVAAAAVKCALLARAGFTGPVGRVLEGPGGYLRAEGGWAPQPCLALEELGTRWFFTDTLMKPYPCCKRIHAAAYGADQLRRQTNLDFGEFESIELHLPSRDAAVTAEPLRGKMSPDSSQAARFSLPYAVGAILARGRLGLEDFQIDRIGARDWRKWSEILRIRRDDALATFTARVAIVPKRGDPSSGLFERLPGSPQKPFSQEELRGRFRENLAFGREVVVRSSIDESFARMLDIRSETDVRALFFDPSQVSTDHADG